MRSVSEVPQRTPTGGHPSEKEPEEHSSCTQIKSTWKPVHGYSTSKADGVKSSVHVEKVVCKFGALSNPKSDEQMSVIGSPTHPIVSKFGVPQQPAEKAGSQPAEYLLGISECTPDTPPSVLTDGAWPPALDGTSAGLNH